jgi:hypothetical protein
MPDEVKRGQVGNIAKATQWRDYSGLRFERNITPTDIDGSVDFDGELFVMLEYKSKGAPLSHGQRLHLESHTNAINEGSKRAACLVCEHETPPDEPIDGAAARVVEYLWWGNQKWLRPSLSIDTYSAILKLKAVHAHGLEAVK